MNGRVTSAGDVDLHLDLDATGPRRAVLAEALRDAIRTGRLGAGTRLPSYRALASELGLARNTVADTYAHLVSEGWLTARQGSGTRVAASVVDTVAAAHTSADRSARHKPGTPTFDLRPGTPDSTSFPRTAWLASTRRAVNRAPNEAFGAGDPQGRVELRRALAAYLGRTRGVRTDAEHVVVCSGFSQAMGMLVPSVLDGPLAAEAYGLPFHRGLLEVAHPTIPLDLDEQGTVVAGLFSADVVAAVLTPAHQFPTGVALHPERRAAALDWARRRDGLIVEDDYDGEFRYDREPIGALQGLDPDHVLYVGSVSKSLAPSIRLGWMVVPDRLLDAVLAMKGEREKTVSVIDQLTLADLIACGGYDRHIRQMRSRYRRRRDLFVGRLSALAPGVAVGGIAAGLQAVVQLPAGTEVPTLRTAAEIGLAVDGLSYFRHPRAATDLGDGVVVGYATPPEHNLPTAIEALCASLRASRR